MLGDHDDGVGVVDVFESIPCLVELPAEWVDYFNESGPVTSKFEDNRRYPRKNLRVKSIIKRRGVFHGVYAKDVSRTGVAFFFHEQLFPCEQVQLFLPNKSNFQLRCIYCRRVKKNCFHCGMEFITQSNS